MGQGSFIPVATNARSRSDLVERGFSRQPLRVDVDIARSLEALSNAAWSVPKDKYYDGGDRYRSLNRVRAEIVEGGVKVWLSEESTPYVQLKKYNTTIGGQPREYAPLSPAIAGSIGVRKMIAHHLYYLPLSTVGTKYLVNVHLIRFTATPGRPCDTSPPGLHKDGEKYIATHLVGRCGAQGGEVVSNTTNHYLLVFSPSGFEEFIVATAVPAPDRQHFLGLHIIPICNRLGVAQGPRGGFEVRLGAHRGPVESAQRISVPPVQSRLLPLLGGFPDRLDSRPDHALREIVQDHGIVLLFGRRQDVAVKR